MEYHLGAKICQLELTGTIKYTHEGNWVDAYAQDDGTYAPGYTADGEPMERKSGWVETTDDFNDTMGDNSHEGPQWCANCNSRVRRNREGNTPETTTGHVLRSHLRLSFYTWHMVCEWCNQDSVIDAQEYQQLKKYYLKIHNITIAPHLQIVSNCAETYGAKVAYTG